MRKLKLLKSQNLSNPLVKDRYLIKDLDVPAFVMSPPIGFSADIPNNESMKLASKREREIDREKALAQWLSLYGFLASQSIVYLAPTPQQSLQDLVFTSNLGVVLDDFDRDLVIISNFSAEGRGGETEVGRKFFEDLGFETHICPYHFEGDAELKKIGSKLYVGGYGNRTDIKAYEWMEEKFGIKVIKVSPQNKFLYHLDCNFLPITSQDALCCLDSFEDKHLKLLEKNINLIEIPNKFALYGACSALRFYDCLIVESSISEELEGEIDYKIENEKNRLIEDICVDLDLEPIFINISEFYKGGADISCLAMSLNHYGFFLEESN